MKVVVAPNAFKGSLRADQAARAMAAGVKRAWPEATVVQVPVADGGDGLVEVLGTVLRTTARTVSVTGPDGRPVRARYLCTQGGRTAIIEMALASGLALVSPPRRDPMQATSFGTGELMAHAVGRGARRLVVGLGGSATCDGGVGMAAALGVRFLDRQGKTVSPCGAGLIDIVDIDTSGLDGRFALIAVEAVCDVTNPLLGATGAARAFAAQKGGTATQVRHLERGMRHFASVLARWLGRDVARRRGAGAAGGLGAALYALLDAKLRPGAEVVLDLVGFDAALAGADLVLTGEGRIDDGTVRGKAPGEVARRAKKAGIPCVAIAGSVGGGLTRLRAAGLTAAFSLCPGPVLLDDAMLQAARLLSEATEQIIRAIAILHRR